MSKPNIKWIIPLSLFAAGLVGGFLHFMHLRTGYDALDLPIAGNRYAAALLVLVLAVLAVCCIGALLLKRKPVFSEEALYTGTIGISTLLSTALAVLAAVAATVYSMLDAYHASSVWRFFNSLLLLSTAVFTVPVIKRLSSKRDVSSMGAVSALIIVLWACFRLIEMYRGSAPNPAIGMYVYDLLAAIALILMLFTCAGYLCARASVFRLYCMVSFYLFFGTLSLTARTALVLAGASWKDNAAHVLICLYGLFVAAAILSLFFRPQRKESLLDE